MVFFVFCFFLVVWLCSIRDGSDGGDDSSTPPPEEETDGSVSDAPVSEEPPIVDVESGQSKIPSHVLLECSCKCKCNFLLSRDCEGINAYLHFTKPVE